MVAVLFSYLEYLLLNRCIAEGIRGFQALEWVIEVDTLGRESRQDDRSGWVSRVKIMGSNR
ncbi:MAG: hypothetical protein CK520_00080 [Actinobacteria bacterium]|nr:MAG: hypothetical protein CK520_00080 [Actinomycetota bacterium]